MEEGERCPICLESCDDASAALCPRSENPCTARYHARCATRLRACPMCYAPIAEARASYTHTPPPPRINPADWLPIVLCTALGAFGLGAVFILAFVGWWL